MGCEMSSITITAGSHPDSYAADPVGSQGVVVGEGNTCDKEADVLYLNFKKPSHADNSELTDDDLIIRYEKGSVVGITVLNASKRRAG